MNTYFETNFVVMPADCNYMYPMIFGGSFFSKMDLAAAACVSRLLHDSECDSAVTHKFSGTFHAAAECGDLVFLKCEVVELRTKSIRVIVRATREKRAEPGTDYIAEAEFIFCSKKDGKITPHGLKLPRYCGACGNRGGWYDEDIWVACLSCNDGRANFERIEKTKAHIRNVM
jgi:acyl-CoA hydrolase